MPTLKDIAGQAGVSVATVSRALNSHPGVNEGTREAIVKIARDMGYQDGRTGSSAPSSILFLARQSLAPNSKELEHWSGEFEYRAMYGAQAVFDADKVSSRVLQLDLRNGVQDRLLTFVDSNVVGIVILGGVFSREFVQSLRVFNVPVVAVGAHAPDLAINTVAPDFLAGTFDATNLLAQRGRRCIALINGPDISFSSEEKLRGYRLALALNDIPFRSEIVRSGEFLYEVGFAATERLLTSREKVDAIVYGDDRMAVGGLRAIKNAGRIVPDDIAITGMMDFEVSHYVDPPLTSINYGINTMGAIAARRLLALIADPADRDPWNVVMPSSLVIRSSS